MDRECLHIQRAKTVDLAEILALLSATNLPHEGVIQHLASFYVARDQKGKLIGCAGYESYQKLGLLRSVAIEPSRQKSGLGAQLITFLIKAAVSDGIEELVLLTTTAKDFFSRRFNFLLANRSKYNDRLKDSVEWHLPRCSSAVFMSLKVS